MRKIFILTLILLYSIIASAHPWKPSHYVIIDSDAGTDDMKAISLLLASPDVRVLAIIASPGVMSAEKARVKLRSLLDSYHHEGIPVAICRLNGYNAPDFEVAVNYSWGIEKKSDVDSSEDYFDVINNIIKHENSKITYIALGGLTSISAILRSEGGIKKQINKLIWSCNGLNDRKGFNYNIDRSSSQEVLKSTIPVYAVRTDENTEFYNPGFISECAGINSIYAEKIIEFQSSPSGKDHPFARELNDEHAALFLQFPELYLLEKRGDNFDCSCSNLKALTESYFRMLSGETVKKNQVIKLMPGDSSFYSRDISPYVAEIIQKYGEDEWTSGVVANELHRHLGVFAIIGVKMGIRAREYFDTGVDEFRAVSFAGSEPPLSCMNDGIQVSTGATPGHGLLTVRNDSVTMPSAEFSYLGNVIRLTLKPEIAKIISSELKEINYVYGLDSNIYWELVRKNSIKYWKNLDRHEIFNIEVLK